jgi:single-strand selective monofunctional uracil DNA glycosylase
MDRFAALAEAARSLSRELATLAFAPPVTAVYDPLTYAWAGHEAYRRLAGPRQAGGVLG